ncbi:phage tail tape measure protein [Anaeroselena agilis]|uniref:Phage tail tape measure protein n=1 Tax=Anaeroselena agilis TaxID=3063788 RepID=A0ABU3NYG1_9FIRM|nr:phage tail tape measure protein [Selenomonadales bacterium 4137-cl]
MASKVHEIVFAMAGKLSGSFSGTFSSASQKLADLQMRSRALKVSLRELDAAQRKGKISVLEYAASYEKLTVQLHKVEQLQGKVNRLTKMQNTAGAVADRARSGMMKSAAAGAALAVPAAAAISFDTEMAYVAKQVDNARDDTGKLTEIGLKAKEDILAISRDLKTLPDEIAKAYALSARSGVKGAENLRKMTEMGVMMGKAFEMPADQVSTDMAKIGNALGYDLETAEGIAKLEALADKINYVDDQTLAAGPDLIDFMTRTGKLVKGLAPTMSEGMTVGLGAGMLAAGERAEVAGTAVNAMLTRFAAAPTQAKGFQEALAQIGLTAEELQGSMIKNADGAILDLFNRINQLDQAAKNNVMAELIGQNHIDTISLLTGNYDKFLDAVKKANSEAAKGSVRKEFAILSQTAKAQLEGTQAALARTMGAFGEGLLPDINEKAQGLAAFAESVGKFARAHPQLTSAVMTGAAGLTVFALAASSVTWVVSSAVGPFIRFHKWMVIGADGVSKYAKVASLLKGVWSGLGSLLSGLSGLAMRFFTVLLTNPLGWFVLAIVGVGVALYALYQNFESVRNAIDGAWQKFKETFPNAAAFLQSIGDKVAWLADKFKNLIGVQRESAGMGGLRAAEAVVPHALGGIFNRPHVGLIAEAGVPEAAIPLDGSARSVSLWEKAGQMLGVGGGGLVINATFAPVINGGGPQAMDELQRAQDNFIAQMKEAFWQQGRVALE